MTWQKIGRALRDVDAHPPHHRRRHCRLQVPRSDPAAPAMNPRMWRHPATRRNIALLAADGVQFVGPNVGEMAERGEAGPGRMAEPLEILAAIERVIGTRSSEGPAPLAGESRAAEQGLALAGRH